jgi:hypothetical protein
VGVDGDIGYTFTRLHYLRLHAGGYYFRYQHHLSTQGAEGGIELPFNKYFTLEFKDSYDNTFHNTALVSLRFTWGGLDKSAQTPDVDERILDPLRRHTSALSGINQIPVRARMENILINHGKPVPEQHNIWFFNAASGDTFDATKGVGNCTFEHPCIGTSFTQTNVDTINQLSPNTVFYFTPGTYSLNPRAPFDLLVGQSMFGRNSDFSQPALVMRTAAISSDSIATFVGELDPLGNNTLQSFALIHDANSTIPGPAIGIHVQNANNVAMSNLQIGQFDYDNPVKLDNANHISLQNSALKAAATGIYADNHSQNVQVGDNTIQVASPNNGGLMGVLVDGASNVNLTNNLIIVTNNIAPAQAVGVLAFNGSQVVANNNTLNISGNSFNIVGFANSGSTLTAEANTVNTISTNASGGIAIGVVTNNNGQTTLTNNTFTGVTTSVNGGTTAGIINDTGSTTTMNGNDFILITGANSTIVGIFNNGAVNGSNNIFQAPGPGSKTCVAGNPIVGSNNTFNGVPC